MKQTQQLQNDLTTAFSEKGLQSLCSGLGVSYRNLPGESQAEKAQALIERVMGEKRVPALVQAVVDARPGLATHYQPDEDLNWLDQIAGGMGAPITEPPTSKWPSDPGTGEAGELGWIDQAAGGMGTAVEEPPTWRWPTETEEIPGQEKPDAAKTEPALVNPYTPGAPVTDEAHFFGREEAWKRIRSRLQNMGSVSIVGMRHIGKSSLLRYVCREGGIGEEWRFCFAVLAREHGRGKSHIDLLNEALRQWYGAVGHDASPVVQSVDEFVRQVRRLMQAGHRPVLCLDDFEWWLAQWDNAQERLLEAWYMLGNMGQLALVVTSQNPLPTLLRAHGLTSSFDHIFVEVSPGLLSAAETAALLTEPAMQQGVVMPDEAVEKLAGWCGPHPLFLQIGAYHLFRLVVKGEYSVTAVRDAFLEEAEIYWHDLWNALLPVQQNLLLSPLQTDAPLVVKRQYRQLCEAGILVEEPGSEYRFFSEAFAAWVQLLQEMGSVAPGERISADEAGDNRTALLARLQALLD